MKLQEKIKALPTKIKNFFIVESGDKKTVSIKRAAFVGIGSIAFLAVAMAWFGPGEDHTFYNQTSAPEQSEIKTTLPVAHGTSSETAGVFNSGQKQLETEKRLEAQRRRPIIKYFAPQVIGANTKAPKVIQMGSKLVGFLMKTIDTRSNDLVRVRISRGGESSGVEIPAGTILTGQFSYPGSGDKIFLSFSRMDTPEGEIKRLSASALDVGTYSSGISGEVYSDAGVKVAAQMGLTMFAGMTDVLTEKESLGGAFTQNGVQAKPTMKNALLQGTSRAAQDQASRTSSEIESSRDYLIVPEGKEMIIELREDFKNERN